ncbi:hypothetical protein ES702_01131 [subsurface metagenome]
MSILEDCVKESRDSDPTRPMVWLILLLEAHPTLRVLLHLLILRSRMRHGESVSNRVTLCLVKEVHRW